MFMDWETVTGGIIKLEGTLEKHCLECLRHCNSGFMTQGI